MVQTVSNELPQSDTSSEAATISLVPLVQAEISRARVSMTLPAGRTPEEEDTLWMAPFSTKHDQFRGRKRWWHGSSLTPRGPLHMHSPQDSFRILVAVASQTDSLVVASSSMYVTVVRHVYSLVKVNASHSPHRSTVTGNYSFVNRS